MQISGATNPLLATTQLVQSSPQTQQPQPAQETNTQQAVQGARSAEPSSPPTQTVNTASEPQQTTAAKDDNETLGVNIDTTA